MEFDFQDVKQFAESCFDSANIAATVIQFSLNEEHARYAKGARVEEPYSISSEPQFAELENYFGMAAHSVILSVDLRQSSKRAVEIGAKNTYLTMHTYLPTMAELVAMATGKIVGLRGDGLFAAFGLAVKGNAQQTQTELATSVKNATNCGKGMLETIDDIINPLLARKGIRGDLSIGVGIAVGEVVVTRIGIRDANEITVYGPPVNQACKLCSKVSGVALTKTAEQCYPTSKGGRMRFSPFEGGFRVNFPSDYAILRRTVPKKTK